MNQLKKEVIFAEKDTDDEEEEEEETEINDEEGKEDEDVEGKKENLKEENDGKHVDERSGNDTNDINSLERYEFIEMVVTIAYEMFNQKRRLGSLAEAFKYLVTEKIMPNVWDNVECGHFFANPNAFRFKRFYREETNAKFIERADKLYTIFLYQARLSQRRYGLIGERLNPQLAYEEYYEFLRKGGMMSKRSGITTQVIRLSFQFSQMLVVDELKVTSHMDNIDTFYRCTFTEFCEALCWMAQLALKEREEQAAIKSTHFSQVLGLVLDEVISCMSKDWWKKTHIKSWKKRNDRHGKDRNRVMRVGETPEIDMHETSLEEENSIHERIEYPNRNVYKLPDPVTRALGRDFHNYCS